MFALIQQLKMELNNERELSTQEHAVLYAVCKSAVLVGETLLEQNAILLPEVFDYFISTYNTVKQSTVQQTSISSSINSTWFLNQLSALLDYHMSYT